MSADKISRIYSAEACRPQCALAPFHAVGYLQSYGYAVALCPPLSNACWRQTQSGSKVPALDVHVNEHFEMSGHTWYVLECSLAITGVYRLEWTIPRRLCQLRGGLHDEVKEEVGPGAYQQLFLETAFASRGGPPGTTARLESWCGSLVKAINRRAVCPKLVALTLRFLNAPTPSRTTEFAERVGLEEDVCAWGQGDQRTASHGPVEFTSNEESRFAASEDEHGEILAAVESIFSDASDSEADGVDVIKPFETSPIDT